MPELGLAGLGESTDGRRAAHERQPLYRHARQVIDQPCSPLHDHLGRNGEVSRFVVLIHVILLQMHGRDQIACLFTCRRRLLVGQDRPVEEGREPLSKTMGLERAQLG